MTTIDRPVSASGTFALGQHLLASGRADAAVRWFRESHRLQPDNWTYRRQTWSLANPSQGPTQAYEGDWLSDVQKSEAQNYYPPVELEPRRPR